MGKFRTLMVRFLTIKGVQIDKRVNIRILIFVFGCCIMLQMTQSEYKFSKHALTMLRIRREIKEEWIWKTIETTP